MGRLGRAALLVVSACLLALVGLSGCLATAQTEAVTLGLAAPFEGARRDLGYAVLGAVRLAIAEQNAAGGWRGRPVTLAALNDEDEPAQARLRARELSIDPSVIAVVGHWSWAATAAALPVYQAAGLRLVVPVAGGPALEDERILRLAPGDDELARVAVEYARQAGYRRVLLRVEPAALRSALEVALPAAGIQIGDERPDAAFLWLDDEATARFLRAGEPRPVLLLSAPYLPLLAKLAPLNDPRIVTWVLEPAEPHALAAFEAAYAAQAGQRPAPQARLAYLAARAALGAPASGWRLRFAPAGALLAP
jgi:hypothetical protein